jgi:hypothetical protein
MKFNWSMGRRKPEAKTADAPTTAPIEAEPAARVHRIFGASQS